MSTLVAIAYPDADTAERVRAELIQATKEHLLTLEDAVVVVHQPDGKIKLHQATSMAGVGAAGGAMWGGLIGLLFLAPLFGMAIGAATGAVAGKASDVGVNDGFLKELGAKLPPGGAALIALGQAGARDKLLERVAPVRRRRDPDLAQQRGRGAAAHGARRARRGRLVMARLLTDEQTVELLALAKHSDSVELKLTIAESEQRSALLALRIDPLDAQIRQVFFFDTPDLRSTRPASSCARAACRTRGTTASSSCDRSTRRRCRRSSARSPSLRGRGRCHARGLRVLGHDEAACCRRPRSRTRWPATVRSGSCSSKEQRAFYETYAPEGIGLDDLTILGPVFVLKLKQTPPELGRRLVDRAVALSRRLADPRALDPVRAERGVPGGGRDARLPGRARHRHDRRTGDQDQARARVLQPAGLGTPDMSGRWEWRSFGASFGEAEARLAALTPDAQRGQRRGVPALAGERRVDQGPRRRAGRQAAGGRR